jgi:hypothetical protein
VLVIMYRRKKRIIGIQNWIRFKNAIYTTN